MDRKTVEQTFEKYFEKYKKTEGDRTSWSAHWSAYSSAGTLEIIMNKCPEGTTFKVYKDSKKLREISGWDSFFDEMEAVSSEHPGLYDEDEFFSSMQDMI